MTLPHNPKTTSNTAAPVDYERFLDCVHCGLCTSACPTYVELGNENDSPRGRIHLMRALTDGRMEMTPQVQRHLDLCLDCRACETACPSGVQYGRLIEPFRISMQQVDGQPAAASDDWFHRWILFGLFPHPERLKRSLRFARWAQRLGLDQFGIATGLIRLLPARLQQLVSMLPAVPPPQQAFPNVLPAKGKRRARVGLLTGCVADAMFGSTHWATIRVLQENGCDVVVPKGQVCCGAIHFHAGQERPAKQLADENIGVFDAAQVDAVVVNVAGCGAMMKDYGHHWNDSGQTFRREFATKVRDVNEFLDDLGLVPPMGELRGTATYHDACHLAHAQNVMQAPRRLLHAIPGLEWVELPETELCCGAAGTYNLTEPEMAERLGRRKLRNVLATGASTIATANAGCLLQIARHAREQGHRLRVVHPMDLLDCSYRGVPLDSLQ